jgi:hypothetical protein
MYKRPVWTAALATAALFLSTGGCSSDCKNPACQPRSDGAVVPDRAAEEDQKTAPDQETREAARVTELKTFSEVLAAHRSGGRLRAIFKYEECTLDGGPGLRATGGTYPVAAEHVAKSATVPRAHLAFSDAKLILNPQLYPVDRDSHVYNTARIQLFEDGSVVVLSNYLDYVSKKITMSERWDCNLGAGKGAYFFLESPRHAPDEPVQLESYEAAVDAVFGGEPVSAVIDIARCALDGASDKDATSDPATISMAIGTFEWFDMPASGISNRIVWSEASLVRDPRDPTAGYVYRYVKVSLRASGEAQLTRQYVDVATGAGSLHQTYACQLDAGDGKAGLRLVRR